MADELATTPHGWTILDRERGVLSCTYGFASGASANCFTVRLRCGGLLVVSPPAGIDDAAIDELLEFGPVVGLAPNNGFHHLGMGRWRARFPEARCFAAPKAAARIARKSKTAGRFEPLSELLVRLADHTEIREASSTKCGELWVRVLGDHGYVWYTSDLLANLPTLPASLIPRLLFRWTRSAPGYRVFNLAAKFILDDKKAVLREMLDDVRAHPPAVVVPAHGSILTDPGLARDTERVLLAAVA
jgi:hypothetical protein